MSFVAHEVKVSFECCRAPLLASLFGDLIARLSHFATLWQCASPLRRLQNGFIRTCGAAVVERDLLTFRASAFNRTVLAFSRTK
jgi:hypothetical protein